MTALYREFTTVEELNVEYDIDATVPDFGVYAEYFMSRSATTRARGGATLDIAYGPTLAETFDLFPGEGEGLRPALFFVHGGAWHITDSKVWSYVADGMAPLGITTVVEDYALAPGATIAEIVRQHRAAFAHVWKNAEELGIDRDRIVIAGHSAGGHAVGMLLCTDWSDYGMPALPYAGALSVSALMDMRPLPYTLHSPWVQLDQAGAEALSPMLQLPTRLPPTVAAVGLAETSEFERQSRDWVAACQAAGLPAEFRTFQRNHFDILDELADPAGAMAAIVAGMLVA